MHVPQQRLATCVAACLSCSSTSSRSGRVDILGSGGQPTRQVACGAGSTDRWVASPQPDAGSKKGSDGKHPARPGRLPCRQATCTACGVPVSKLHATRSHGRRTSSSSPRHQCVRACMQCPARWWASTSAPAASAWPLGTTAHAPRCGCVGCAGRHASWRLWGSCWRLLADRGAASWLFSCLVQARSPNRGWLATAKKMRPMAACMRACVRAGRPLHAHVAQV